MQKETISVFRLSLVFTLPVVMVACDGSAGADPAEAVVETYRVGGAIQV